MFEIIHYEYKGIQHLPFKVDILHVLNYILINYILIIYYIIY